MPRDTLVAVCRDAVPVRGVLGLQTAQSTFIVWGEFDIP